LYPSKWRSLRISTIIVHMSTSCLDRPNRAFILPLSAGSCLYLILTNWIVPLSYLDWPDRAFILLWPAGSCLYLALTSRIMPLSCLDRLDRAFILPWPALSCLYFTLTGQIMSRSCLITSLITKYLTKKYLIIVFWKALKMIYKNVQ